MPEARTHEVTAARRRQTHCLPKNASLLPPLRTNCLPHPPPKKNKTKILCKNVLMVACKILPGKRGQIPSRDEISRWSVPELSARSASRTVDAFLQPQARAQNLFLRCCCFLFLFFLFRRYVMSSVPCRRPLFLWAFMYNRFTSAPLLRHRRMIMICCEQINIVTAFCVDRGRAARPEEWGVGTVSVSFPIKVVLHWVRTRLGKFAQPFVTLQPTGVIVVASS